MPFANLLINEPIDTVMEDWDFLSEKVVGKFSGFKEVGQQVVGVRHLRPTETGVVDTVSGGQLSEIWLIEPFKGLTKLTEAPKPLDVGVIVGGTPHHAAHYFGYWHINDRDELFIPLPPTGPDTPIDYLLFQQMPEETEGDRFAWYCLECLTLLFERYYPTGASGMNGFWKAERAAVTEYNQDSRHRTCPECGTVNPEGYCWQSRKDTPVERQARTIW